MKKFKRDYELKGCIDIQSVIGLGIAIGNEQPKNNYATAWWSFNILFLCWQFSLRLSYNYKK